LEKRHFRITTTLDFILQGTYGMYHRHR
jgi:hypothetical protein